MVIPLSYFMTNTICLMIVKESVVIFTETNPILSLFFCGGVDGRFLTRSNGEQRYPLTFPLMPTLRDIHFNGSNIIDVWFGRNRRLELLVNQ